jgi:two-component system, sensor histidine kinase LadS
VTERYFQVKTNWQVTCCDNGHSAIEKFRKSPCDAILLDINMPEMRGPDIVAEIRKIESKSTGSKVPIIAVTANTSAEQVAEYLKTGFSKHLSKPIIKHDVVGIVRSLVPLKSKAA